MVFVMRAVSAAAAVVLATAGTAVAADGDPPPTRADIAADALRENPVHVSPHLDPKAVVPQDAERIRAAVARLKAAGIPVYVSVSPVWDGDGSGRFGIAYLALLHDRLRTNGAYIHVDESGRTRIRAYGVRPAGDPATVEDRLRGREDDRNASLADLAVLAVDGLRTGTVPGGRTETSDPGMADGGPEYRAEKAALVVGAVGAVLVAVLGLLHRFTELPLWPRRRRRTVVPEVDWSSAPALPDRSYATLYDLAERRRDALTAAINTAAVAGLPLDGSAAAIAEDLADDLLICCIAPDDQAADSAQAGSAEDAEGREIAEGVDLPDLVATIEISRLGMLALAALRDGVPFAYEPPCFHDPLHERGSERDPHPGEGEPAQVAVCPACAADDPEPLLVWSDEGPEPYWVSEYTNPVWRATGYGAATPDLEVEQVLECFAAWVDDIDDIDDEALPDEPVTADAGPGDADRTADADEGARA